MGKAAAEQKSGPVACVYSGCEQELAPAAEFTVVAWCTQRKSRLALKLAAVLGDQGDVGDPVAGRGEESKQDSPVAGAATAASTSTAADSKAPSHADKAERIRRFLSDAINHTTDRERIVIWAASETASVRAWEERMARWIRTAADDCCALIKDIETRRLSSYASLAVQRLSLRVSFEEIATELESVAADNAERQSNLARLSDARVALVKAFEDGRLQVNTAATVRQVSRLPACFSELASEGQARPERAAEVIKLAKQQLLWCCDKRPIPVRSAWALGGLFPAHAPAFPKLPRKVRSPRKNASLTC